MMKEPGVGPGLFYAWEIIGAALQPIATQGRSYKNRALPELARSL